MSVNEVEFLKQQLIAKDEMISFLKTQLLALQNKLNFYIIYFFSVFFFYT